ncbi:hypothetical protein DERF_006588 [Dermatophagoides farinae]|uniref:Transmembrane protein n=1 Tax=Dermatophagoides farinae TaxID=6954 RepID=A0A922HW78_DERFA|nr:hypothetical protein DERF_006588 [Dermatophagoides farinae]
MNITTKLVNKAAKRTIVDDKTFFANPNTINPFLRTTTKTTTTKTDTVNATDLEKNRHHQKLIDEKYYALIVNSSTNRTVRLINNAQYILLSLSIWQLVLIICNLYTILISIWRKRNQLVIYDRTFYWLSFLQNLFIFFWATGSISTIITTTIFMTTTKSNDENRGEKTTKTTTTTITKRTDNLSSFTMFGMFALILIVFEILLFYQLLLFISRTDNPLLLNGFGWQETSHLLILPISRIICFSLWIYFMNHQLSLMQWSKEEFQLPMVDPLTEDITLNTYSPFYIGRIMPINN